MNLFMENKPHIRSKDSSNIIMSDILIAMAFLVVLSFLFFGIRPLYIILSSVIICYILDTTCISLRKKRFFASDLSSIITAVIISLLMPATIPLYVPITASAFSILIIKQCFGGLGQNIFNPAAGGVAFAALCWPDQIFKYTITDIVSTTDFLVPSALSSLKYGKYPVIEILDMLIGKQPGSIGTIHILVILSCLIWLIIRKSIYFPSIVSFLATCAIIAFIFPRIHSNRMMSVIYELLSGSLLFGCIFIMTDPVTSPKHNCAKILYSIIIGILTMIFRYYSDLEQGICFAILLGNSIAFSLDKLSFYLRI